MSTGYRCMCPPSSEGKPISVMLEHIEALPLAGGGHTGVTPLICGVCKKIDFMPVQNWDLFLKRGEPEAVAEWEAGFTKLVEANKPAVLKSFFNKLCFWRK